MESWVITLITALTSILASSGFWALMVRKVEKKDAQQKLLLGLAHDRIVFLGLKYIERGWITSDELENLVDYLYEPYHECGGNGTAEEVVNQCKKLEIRRGPISS